MATKDDLKSLLSRYENLLQKLKEQEAVFGPLHAPAHLLIEIEDVEAKIEKLAGQLKELDYQAELRSPNVSPSSPADNPAQKRAIKGKLFWLWVGIGTVVLIVVMGLVAILIWGNKDPEYRVLVDIYHGDPLLEEGDYNTWELRQSGFEFENAEKPLTLDTLLEYDVLVISFARYYDKQKFSEQELNAVREYLYQGGSLFLIGLGWVWTSDRNDNPPIENYPLNIIVDGSGIYFTSGAILEIAGIRYENAPIVFQKPFMADHLITQDVDRIGASIASPGILAVRPPAIPLIWGDDNTKASNVRQPIILAAANVGKGKLVCLQHGDYVKPFTNKYDNKDFLNVYDNLRLLKNILTWLVN